MTKINNGITESGHVGDEEDDTMQDFIAEDEEAVGVTGTDVSREFQKQELKNRS